jgi:phenylacetate-CoA oxygenase/reductase, PaaK subunit
VARFHKLTVADVERLCDDAVAVTFAVPDDLRTEFAFRPGQYLTLRLVVDGVEERRSYSICAPAGAAPRVGVRRVDGGLFSEWLVDRLQPGDTVEVAPPAGQFTPDLTRPGHHGMIAAGSGITPVLSIAATVLANPESAVTLIYGNRRTDTVMFAEELADLKNLHGPRLQLIHVLSREPMAAEIFSGRLDADRLGRILDHLVLVDDVDEWWLCGPYGMTTGAQEVLRARGVAKERVHRELFYVDEPPPAVHRAEATVSGETSEVTVVLDGRSTTLTLPRAETVLDAAQKVRADLPFACKGGVCGTCRARVREGEVQMRRNFALEDDEIAAGFVLTCQSHPVTASVTVDYDA